MRPLVSIKKRTIIAYRDERGRQCQTQPLSETELDGYLETVRRRPDRWTLLYIVRCHPRVRR